MLKNDNIQGLSGGKRVHEKYVGEKGQSQKPNEWQLWRWEWSDMDKFQSKVPVR